MQSAKEKENKKLNEEILQLLSKPTTKVQQNKITIEIFCKEDQDNNWAGVLLSWLIKSPAIIPP